MGTTFSARVRAEFLEYLRTRGNASAAARAVELSYSTVRKHYLADESFREEWDDALAEAAGVLEAAVYQRAVHGVSRPKVLKDGTFVRYPADYPVEALRGTIVFETQYDSGREIAQLKKRMPEEYRERTDSKVTANVQTTDMDDETLIAKARKILDDIALRADGERPDGVRDIAYREVPGVEDIL